MRAASVAPVAVFAFNRPDHLQRTLASLEQNEMADRTDLVVFCDGPRNEGDVKRVRLSRERVRAAKGFRSLTIIERDQNLGLANSIIQGVTEVCREHGRVIVVEDDLVTSPFFLRYMNDALHLYERDEQVISIHGYVYPVKSPLPETFFLRGADCWGWATWQRGWALFNQDANHLLTELHRRDLTDTFNLDGAYDYSQTLEGQGKGLNNSWAIRWHASAFLAERLTLYPGKSLVQNIGYDASGTHCDTSSMYDVTLARHPVTVERLPLVENAFARQLFAEYFRGASRPSRWRRLAGKLFGWRSCL